MKITLIGCGDWGKFILRDLVQLGCEVTVVTKSEKGILNAQNGGASKVVNDFVEVEKSDGVVIAVPTIFHYQVIRSVLNIAPTIPIYCEKPICVNSIEAEELFQLAPHNLFVMDKWRYHMGVLALGQIVKTKELGKVHGLQLFRNGWGNPHKDTDCAWHLLPHDLSICIELLGYLPKAVFANWDKANNNIRGIKGYLKDKDYWVSFESSQCHPVSHREIIVFAEHGIAKLTDSYSDTIEIYKTDIQHLKLKPQIEKRLFDNVMPLLSELKAFLGFIKGDSVTVKSSCFEGLQIVKHIEAIRALADQP